MIKWIGCLIKSILRQPVTPPPLRQPVTPPLLFRFKKSEERVEYIHAMKTLLPLLYQRVMAILPDSSLPSVTLQHHVLKIFYATMQVLLLTDLAVPPYSYCC